MPIRQSCYVLALFLSLFSLSAHTAFAVTRDITFPVSGVSSFRDDFHEPRGDGTREHLGIDIVADKMVPVVAAVDGVVTYVVTPEASWGYSISIRDSEGYQYRYLHLNNDTPGTDDGAGGEANAYVAGIKRGVAVTAGQHIGWVGDSGNAEATVSHLHFEIRDPSRAAINPYESLVAGAAKSPISASIHIGSAPVIAHPSEEKVWAEDLYEGDQNDLVSQVQTKLKALGYFKGTVTGFFGPITREAVRSFQVALKLGGTGHVDALTWAKIEEEFDRLPIGLPVSGSAYIFTQTLTQGSRGEEVRQLQIKLQTLGYFATSPTGYFGPVTKAAVISFQKAKGLEPVGLVGPKTRAALNKA